MRGVKCCQEARPGGRRHSLCASVFRHQPGDYRREARSLAARGKDHRGPRTQPGGYPSRPFVPACGAFGAAGGFEHHGA